MSRKAKVVVACAIACIVLVSVSFGAISWAKNTDKHIPPVAPSPGEIISDYQTPQLTEDEKAEAQEITLQDPRIKEILSGKSYSIENIGVHTYEGNTKIGAVVDISLSEASFVKYDWPTARFKGIDAEGNPSFEITVNPEEGWIDHLSVDVDLKGRTVIEIIPLNFHHRELETSSTIGN